MTANKATDRPGRFTRQQHLYYLDGIEARTNGKPVTSNPLFSEDEYFCYWNCGWHQADMDAGVRVYSGPNADTKKMLAPPSTRGANVSTRFKHKLSTTVQQEARA
jgi:hypothetical protein